MEQEPAHWAHVQDIHLDPHPQYRRESVPIGDSDIDTNRRFTLYAPTLAALVAMTPAAGTEGWAEVEGLRLHFNGTAWRLLGEQAIHRQALGVAASTISSGTLPVIPAGVSLRIELKALSTVAGAVGVRFNGDTGANYNRNLLLISGATISGTGLNTTGVAGSIDLTTIGATTNRWTVMEVLVPGYLDPFHKPFVCRAHDPAASGAGNSYSGGGWWANTAGITSVLITNNAGNFVVGSTLTIYAASAG